MYVAIWFYILAATVATAQVNAAMPVTAFKVTLGTLEFRMR
jgi:hypothetical protein